MRDRYVILRGPIGVGNRGLYLYDREASPIARASPSVTRTEEEIGVGRLIAVCPEYKDIIDELSFLDLVKNANLGAAKAGTPEEGGETNVSV